MPWGWECRQRLVKQRPMKLTKRDRPIALETNFPGPNQYDVPDTVGQPGYSKIKRLPAYTFGLMTKPINKPAAKLNAPLLDVSQMHPKGTYRIPGSLVTPHIEDPPPKTKVPGPGAYEPRAIQQYKRPPAYSHRLAAKPPYQPWDQWTPPPNMYCPPIPAKRPPSYSFGKQYKPQPIPPVPGPGAHEPNFTYVQRTKPAFSFGGPTRHLKPPMAPAPNTYCEKKFKAVQRSLPGQSFGIRHSPYLGVRQPWEKPATLQIQISGDP